jgi:hypothetical protein
VSSPEDYDGKVTQEQIDKLERLRLAFVKAQEAGSSDLDGAREAYQTYAAKILIDLSGKLDPGPDLPPIDPPSPPPTPTSGDRDQFGILKIKADQPGGRIETKFVLEGKMRNYNSGKPSEWSSEYTNNSKTPITNVEVTIYEKINGFKTHEPDTISLKLGGPPHKDGACCWLIPDLMTDGSAKKTMETESPHPHNHPVNPKPLTKIGESIVGKWIGYKGISQQTKTGTRHVESWIHFPVTNIDTVKDEQDKWRQYIDVEITDKKYFKATGSLTTSRLDGVKKDSLPDFKYASVREIVSG